MRSLVYGMVCGLAFSLLGGCPFWGRCHTDSTPTSAPLVSGSYGQYVEGGPDALVELGITQSTVSAEVDLDGDTVVLSWIDSDGGDHFLTFTMDEIEIFFEEY